MSCHHPDDCLCPSPNKPADPSFYVDGKIKASNGISESYIRANLQLDSSEVIFIAGSFRELLLTLPYILSSYEPVSVVFHHEHGWALIDRDQRHITGTVLRKCAKLLLQLNLVSSIDAQMAEFTNVGSDDPGWELVPKEIVLLARCFVDLKSSIGRQFLCSFLGVFLLELWRKAGDTVFVKLMGPGAWMDFGRRYFVYLLLKEGYGWLTKMSDRRMKVYQKIRMIKEEEYLKKLCN